MKAAERRAASASPLRPRLLRRLVGGDELAAGQLAGEPRSPGRGPNPVRIAQDGPAAFYEGAIGRAIHHSMQQQGGFLCLADLQADEAEWWPRFEAELSTNLDAETAADRRIAG